MREPGHVCAVVGMQYGSEGKGVVVAHVADRYSIHVRVGSPNAGHSFYHDGVKHVHQQIPCGAVANPNATIVLGRGALINPGVLTREIQEIEGAGYPLLNRLIIDGKAGVLDEKFAQEEGHTHGEIHARIGSTGEGVGAARVARLNRDPNNFRLFESAARELGLEDNVEDTVGYLNEARDQGRDILLEGTQGFGLSLIHGPWPFATSTDTTVGQMAADCGLSPRVISQILGVARTFPIRVAGNSGPLKNEITWEDLSTTLGKDVIEQTTVTKKVRRVGMWDTDLMRRAVKVNRPTSLAIMFMDYWNPSDEGKTRFSQLSKKSREFVKGVESEFQVPVVLLGTGGKGWKIADRGGRL